MHDQAPGVVAFISAKDVPGENRVKGGASDAPLFAEDRVEYVGQHIGIIVAETPKQAQTAAALVSVRYGHPKVIWIAIFLKEHKPCTLLSPPNRKERQRNRVHPCYGLLKSK